MKTPGLYLGSTLSWKSFAFPPLLKFFLPFSSKNCRFSIFHHDETKTSLIKINTTRCNGLIFFSLLHFTLKKKKKKGSLATTLILQPTIGTPLLWGKHNYMNMYKHTCVHIRVEPEPFQWQSWKADIIHLASEFPSSHTHTKWLQLPFTPIKWLLLVLQYLLVWWHWDKYIELPFTKTKAASSHTMSPLAI